MGEEKRPSIASKAKKSYQKHQEKKAKERAEYEKRIAGEKADEEARQKAISSGDLEPITTNYNLDKDEKVYATFQAQKMGRVDKAVNITQRQGVASRAGCGCCLLGPLGAVLGGVTAPSKTHQTTHEALTTLDQGTMVFTNKRFLFVGVNSMTGLIFDQVLSIDFHVHSVETDLEVKYPEMVKGEYYALTGQDSKIAELWYQGIRKTNNPHKKERGTNG